MSASPLPRRGLSGVLAGGAAAGCGKIPRTLLPPRGWGAGGVGRGSGWQDAAGPSNLGKRWPFVLRRAEISLREEGWVPF